MFDFSYDKENDDLFLYNPRSKSKGSIELGDLILDFNNKKEVVGIQMINASKLIKDISKESYLTVKKLLNCLERCKIDIKPKNNVLIIKIFLMSKTKEISSIIPIPFITESSPALASA